MVVLSSQTVQSRSEGRGNTVGREGDLLTVVFVLDVGDGAWAEVEVCACVAIVFSIEGEAVQFALDVVTKDCNLGKASVEGLGGRDVVDVSETEDVVVGLVLEGVWVNVKESG